ncbi:glycosyltransferase [Candidatus Neomarinimicrobiota bacterium]
MSVDAPHLKAHLSYRKFRKPPYRFICLEYEYFLQDSLINELRKCGHVVETLRIEKGMGGKETLRILLRKAMEVKPDGIISLNGMGLDNQGQIVTVLSEMTVPVIIWYLDNHLFNGPYLRDQTPDWAIAFTYERALESSLREAGFQHVFYLPLAADPALSEVKKTSNQFDFLSEKISFVGGTFSKAVEDYYQPDFEQIYLEWQPDFAGYKQKQGRVEISKIFEPFRDSFSAPETFYRFIAYVIARETFRYRRDRLICLQNEPIVIYGPEEWREHLGAMDVRGPVAYDTDTPLVYQNSAVNLSLTTLQQETALNQRYFDVPLCGGFLLGEWQESLSDHFDLDHEIVHFRTDEELRGKARYYLRHPEERAAVINKARTRVLKEHLMKHRVATMLESIKAVCK